MQPTLCAVSSSMKEETVDNENIVLTTRNGKSLFQNRTLKEIHDDVCRIPVQCLYGLCGIVGTGKALHEGHHDGVPDRGSEMENPQQELTKWKEETVDNENIVLTTRNGKSLWDSMALS
mgnify:CR=1 FL=1